VGAKANSAPPKQVSCFLLRIKNSRSPSERRYQTVADFQAAQLQIFQLHEQLQVKMFEHLPKREIR